MRAYFSRMINSFWSGMKKVCLVAGVALIAVATAPILLPLAIGVGLLMTAKWAADHETPANTVVVPAG